MKKISLMAAALMSVSTAALADGPFVGPYVSVAVGVQKDSNLLQEYNANAGSSRYSTDANSSDMAYSASIGYNTQLSNGVIVGLEGVYDRSTGRKEVTRQYRSNGSAGYNVTTDVKYTASLRAKAGVTAFEDSTFLYAALGAATAKVDYTFANGNNVIFSDGYAKEQHTGGLFALGASYRLTDNISIFGEGSHTIYATDKNIADYNNYQSDSKLRITNLKVGLSYSF
ncbi:outer membrane beta-barrel protein [Terasakiella sp. SH-1]|uniref:outer membrane protein n=1 Tax=Terasakiella sp. SH-1 TaxID=2560057 RepID=UPI0010735851|nr:outer membrane beta-barrel protein [Terasakiella sp. SH-1]